MLARHGFRAERGVEPVQYSVIQYSLIQLFFDSTIVDPNYGPSIRQAGIIGLTLSTRNSLARWA